MAADLEDMTPHALQQAIALASEPLALDRDFVYRIEILEDPPGHQHDAAAAGAQALQGIARGGRDDAPLGDRAVVVAGKRVVPHCA